MQWLGQQKRGCIPIILAFLRLATYTPVSKGMEKAAVPEGATGSVMARVDYDGNFYWTQDSKKYEYALQDYGIAAEQYEFGDQVKVYVNDAQKIIQVTADTEDSRIRSIEIGVGVIGSILVPVLLIVCVYMPIAYGTFGKAWIAFYRSF